MLVKAEKVWEMQVGQEEDAGVEWLLWMVMLEEQVVMQGEIVMQELELDVWMRLNEGRWM